ncbi:MULTISPECIES: hypothetical protein [unclassified Methanosarcina]|jgi:hypothetical protein|uniref:hypothetical protein n=1 Tax=unclassified Methanosarcina TaxID=2644672 RepID=UPI0025F2F3AF|nr:MULTISPECIES: hypothetical protein [unclassified Methanosarcina]
MRKYGKLLLSAYIMKRMKSGRSPRSRETMRKYAKLALGAYLLNRLRSERLEKEIEPEEMMLGEEEAEKGKEPSMKIEKIILGGIVGATLLYAIKKLAEKKRGHQIEVE